MKGVMEEKFAEPAGGLGMENVLFAEGFLRWQRAHARDWKNNL